MSMTTELQPKDRFTFGKYKGMTVDQVLRTDPGYILWCAENVERWSFPDDVLTRAHDDAAARRSTR